MSDEFRKFMIYDIMKVLALELETYFDLNELDDLTLIKLYEILVPEESQTVSLKNVKSKIVKGGQ